MKKIYLILMTMITAISMLFSSLCLWGEHFFKNRILTLVEKQTLDAKSNIDIIGGADGPTSIFIATKTSNHSATILYIITICLMIITVVSYVWYFRTHKRKEN